MLDVFSLKEQVDLVLEHSCVDAWNALGRLSCPPPSTNQGTSLSALEKPKVQNLNHVFQQEHVSVVKQKQTPDRETDECSRPVLSSVKGGSLRPSAFYDVRKPPCSEIIYHTAYI